MYTTFIKSLDIEEYTSTGRLVSEIVVSPQIRKVLSFLHERCKKGSWYRNQNFSFIRQIHDFQVIQENNFIEYLAINALHASRYDIFKSLNTTEMNHVNLWSASIQGGDNKCIKHVLALLQRERMIYPELKDSLLNKATSLLQVAVEKNDTLIIKRVLKDSGVNFNELYSHDDLISCRTSVNTFKHLEKYSKNDLTDMFLFAYRAKNEKLFDFLLQRLTCCKVVDFISNEPTIWYQGWKLALFSIKYTATEQDYLKVYQHLKYMTCNIILGSTTMNDILWIHNMFTSCKFQIEYSSEVLNRLCLMIKKTNLLNTSIGWTKALHFRKLFGVISKPENLSKIKQEYHEIIEFFNTNHLAIWERICNTLVCSSGSTYGVMSVVLEMI
jgi:hypothetical protein